MKPALIGSRTKQAILPASREAVEDFLGEFKDSMQGFVPPEHRFAAELLAREALNNAVQHGCHSDPAKSIRCVFRLRDRCLTMVIGDPGDGFDWRVGRSRRAAPSATSGRGMELFCRFANRVRFNRTGNQVTILKRW
jgi:anti-sigma regulatory factor (Ser/Thr protein kinase)